RVGRGDDELAELLVSDLSFSAIVVKRIGAAPAKRSLEACSGIKKARMYHFIIARARTVSDARGRFKNDDVAASQCQLSRDGQTYYASTDNDAVSLVHSSDSDVCSTTLRHRYMQFC